MIKQFFRSSMVKRATEIRGGGGYPRPDVPLIEAYHNKRVLSIFETNVWWYDDIMPEYVVSYQDQHCIDHINVFKVWGTIVPVLLLSVGLFTGYFWITKAFKFEGENMSHGPHKGISYLEYRAKVRLESKKSIFGFETTNETGIISAVPETPAYLAAKIDEYKKDAEYRGLVNSDGKNFVNRVEGEVRSMI